MINSSYSSLAVPANRSFVKELLIVMGASVLISLFSRIAIPLPFTPVPLATQGCVVLFLSAMLGSQRAVAAVSLFLMQGVLGLPVFANGGAGFLYFFGPTGGYLVGYLVAAFVTGWIQERTAKKSAWQPFFAIGMGNLVIFLFGVAWLSRFTGWVPALTLGFLPFVLGDLLKLIVATRCVQRFSRT